MTRSALRTLLTQLLANDLDNFAGESPSASDYDDQLTFAYRRIARKCHLYNPKIVFTPVADTGVYSLTGTFYAGAKLIDVHQVTINGVMLKECDGRLPGLWTMREFVDRYTTWQTASSGVPTKAVVYGQNLLLHSPPTAAVVSDAENFISARYIPADMDDDADIPDLPEEIHPAIAYLAAVYAATPMATEPEMWKRIDTFGQAWSSLVDDIAEQNKNSVIKPGTMIGDAFSDIMVM